MERSVSGFIATLPLKRPDDAKGDKQGKALGWEDACSDYVNNFMAPNLNASLTPMQWEFKFLQFQTAHPVQADRDVLIEVRMEWLGFFMEYEKVADGVMVATELIKCAMRHANKAKASLELAQFAATLVQRFPKRGKSFQHKKPQKAQAAGQGGGRGKGQGQGGDS